MQSEEGGPVRASCHCGAVEIEVVAAPTEITDCNCSICRRYGVLWAYYRPAQVTVRAGATDTYSWGPKTIAFHRCRDCGCVSHWSAFDPDRNWMGVNARLMPPGVVREARFRHLDGADTEQYLD